MRIPFVPIALAAALLAPAPAARAAPVQWSSNLSLSLFIQGLAPLSLTGTGIVTVDSTAGTLRVGAGAMNLNVIFPLVVPVPGNTAVSSISATGINVRSGTFSFGGVTNQIPGEICPPAGPGSGSACVGGGGLGGVMGLTGTVNVVLIPNVVVIPIFLNQARVGQGGSTASPFVFDAAPWTTGAASLNTFTPLNTGGYAFGTSGFASPTSPLGQTGQVIALVTPTFVNALNNTLPILIGFHVELLGVPEPGTGALLVLAAAGLAAALRPRS